MKSMFQKKCVTTITLMLILVIMTNTALGAVNGGQAVDILIPKCEEVMESVKEIFTGTCSISEDSMMGKPGSVFIDFDKAEVRMIGEDSYRKYSFKENDELPFALCVGIILYVVDTTSALNYGVNVFHVENKNTRLLENKEISTFAAQFTTALSSMY